MSANLTPQLHTIRPGSARRLRPLAGLIALIVTLFINGATLALMSTPLPPVVA